jgi:hypothetical protein
MNNNTSAMDVMEGGIDYPRITPLTQNEIDARNTSEELEARIEELESLGYGCEDPEPGTEWVMENVTSTMDGRNIKGRIEHLRKMLTEMEKL